MTRIIPATRSATRYVGSVAAAAKLGVSRSTIHHAVKLGALVPDLRTPRGHVRFTDETLESFREVLASQTLREVASEQRSETALWHVQMLATMVHLLTSKGEVEEVCQAALGIIVQLVPNVHMGHVALAMPTEGDPLAVRVAAHHGYPADAITTYRELGHSAGPYTTEEVAMTGKPRRIDSSAPSGHPIRQGTAVFLKQLDAHSFLALPLLVGGRSIGALVVISHQQQAWDAADAALLSAVADHLGALVAAAQLLSKRRRLLSGGRELVTLALRLNGATPPEDALQQLAEAYRAASGAVGICVVGLGRDLLSGDERLHERAAAAQASGNPALDLPESEGLIQTVVSSGLELPNGEWAGLAAVWPGLRSDLEAQHKLLTIFGGACVLVLSPSNESKDA